MNTCILTAEIVTEPELRYTLDDQTEIAQMLVQFPDNKTEDSVVTLKVIGWREFAKEIKKLYHKGDNVVVEGRLTMLSIERPEGFKEKQAELTASRIHKL
jgi:single-strand DNA-binding protein